MKKRSRVIPAHIRRAVLERDGDKCRDCGAERRLVNPNRLSPVTNLQLHHIIEFEGGGEHTVENLITLCTACHAKRDNKFRVRCAADTRKQRLTEFEARDLITMKAAQDLLGVSYNKLCGIIHTNKLKLHVDRSYWAAKFLRKSELLKLKDKVEVAA
jgi:hypothetical protein